MVLGTKDQQNKDKRSVASALIQRLMNLHRNRTQHSEFTQSQLVKFVTATKSRLKLSCVDCLRRDFVHFCAFTARHLIVGKNCYRFIYLLKFVPTAPLSLMPVSTQQRISRRRDSCAEFWCRHRYGSSSHFFNVSLKRGLIISDVLGDSGRSRHYC